MSRSPSTASPGTSPHGLIEIGRRPGILEYIREVWERREFALAIAFGELRAQNQNTVLGNLWHLLNPLLLAAVFYVLFGIVFKRQGQVQPFLPFLVIGIFTFQFTQKVIMGGARAVTSNLTLMQNIRFPRALLPAAAVIQESAAQLPAIGAMLVLSWGMEVFPRWSWLLVLPLLLLQSVFNLGVALVVARATFHFRDVEHFLPYVMRILFYSSGTFFTLDVIAEASELGAQILSYNPLYAFMTGVRLFVMGDPAVHAGVPLSRVWVVIAVSSVVALIGGFVWFRAAEHEYGLA